MYQGLRFIIRNGWDQAGREGIIVGEPVEGRDRAWIPVLFDDEDDPDFYKPEALEIHNDPRAYRYMELYPRRDK